jgi:hypothetical protein
VPDAADESSYVPTLAVAGYRLGIREPEWYQHRLLMGPDTQVNLRVFSADASEIDGEGIPVATRSRCASA